MTAGIPKAALIAIDDMLDCCAGIRSGQEVLILAETDGLYGGDNLLNLLQFGTKLGFNDLFAALERINAHDIHYPSSPS